MADVLDIKPDSYELQQFHDEIFRPIQPVFNPLGQYCPVKRCSSMYRYYHLRELVTHWQHVHQHRRQIYKCKKCRKVYPRRTVCRSHLKKVHKVEDSMETCIIGMYVVNPGFIHPMEAILPRQGTPPENEEVLKRVRAERELATKARQEKSNTSMAVKLSDRESSEDKVKEWN